MEDRIVITGWSCISSLGLTNEDFQNSYSEKVGYEQKNDWKKEIIGNQYFGSSPAFDIVKEIPSIKPPFPNRYSSLGLLSCLNAITDAGLLNNEKQLEEAAVIITTTLGASMSIQEFLEKLYKKGPDKLSPFVFSKATSNSILGDVTRILKIKGPGALIYGEDSTTYGIDLIKNGHANIVLCGSIDEITEASVQVANELNRLLIPKTEDVFKDVSTSSEKDKFIFGELASYVVVENLESAKMRDAYIYAEVIDTLQYLDSVSNKVIFERSSEDLKNNIEKILKSNNISRNEKILFYGSSCLPWHIKEYEWAALEKLDYNFLYSNSKVGLGEGLSGSNGATISTAILDLKKNKITNLFKDSIFLKNTPQNICVDLKSDEKIDKILINTFSTGGVNTLLLLKKYEK